MHCNVGGADRIARIVLGVILLIVGILVPMAAVWKTIVFVVAAIALVTGIVRFCPANYLFGINTCKPKAR